MMKVIWRFNLATGVDEREFFAWLRCNVWASSAEFGCRTTAFRIEGEDAGHAFSTEATWSIDEARTAWQASSGFAGIPNYPGSDSPWGAQTDLQMCVYREVVT